MRILIYYKIRESCVYVNNKILYVERKFSEIMVGIVVHKKERPVASTNKQ